MKIIFKTLFIFSILLTINSCSDEAIMGEGSIVTLEREIDLENVDNFETQGIINLNLVFSQTPSAQITGFENIINRVQTEVSGDKLTIKLESGNYDEIEDLSITINTPNLKKITKKGVGNSDVSGFEDLDELTLEIEGTGNVDIVGSATQLNVTSEGIGNLEGENFICDNAQIEMSGIGNCSITCNEELKGSLSGIGDLFYKGYPIIDIDDTGLGEVIDNN